MTKVRLTHNGKAFGRLMHKEVAVLYIKSMQFSILGLHYESVKR